MLQLNKNNKKFIPRTAITTWLAAIILQTGAYNAKYLTSERRKNHCKNAMMVKQDLCMSERINFVWISSFWLFCYLEIICNDHFYIKKVTLDWWVHIWKVMLFREGRTKFECSSKPNCSDKFLFKKISSLVKMEQKDYDFWSKNTKRKLIEYAKSMTTICWFSKYFKYSLSLEQSTNFDAKGAKRTVRMWANNFCSIF